MALSQEGTGRAVYQDLLLSLHLVSLLNSLGFTPRARGNLSRETIVNLSKMASERPGLRLDVHSLQSTSSLDLQWDGETVVTT